MVYLPFAAGNCGLALSLIILTAMAVAIAHSSSIVTKLLLMCRSLAHRNIFISTHNIEAVHTFEDMARVAWGKCGFYIVGCVVYVDLVLACAVMMGTLAFTVDDVIVAISKENMLLDANGNRTDEIDWFYESTYARYIGLVRIFYNLKSFQN